MELGPGVESPLGVGVLDFSPGVPALSRCHGKRDGINICTPNIKSMTVIIYEHE